MIKIIKILKCPKCNSTKIEPHAASLTGLYHCKNCGYIGAIIIEKEIKIKKTNKLHEE